MFRISVQYGGQFLGRRIYFAASFAELERMVELWHVVWVMVVSVTQSLH